MWRRPCHFQSQVSWLHELTDLWHTNLTSTKCDAWLEIIKQKGRNDDVAADSWLELSFSPLRTRADLVRMEQVWCFSSVWTPGSHEGGRLKGGTDVHSPRSGPACFRTDTGSSQCPFPCPRSYISSWNTDNLASISAPNTCDNISGSQRALRRASMTSRARLTRVTCLLKRKTSKTWTFDILKSLNLD